MTKLSKIGEFGLIERFRKIIKTDSSVIQGSGDDCAVIKFNKDKYMLFTCDMLVEGVDFLSRHRPQLVGRKALTVSISDIAACGGSPRYCLVSLGLPRDTSVERVTAISRGLFNSAKRYKINVVGGDLSRADRLTIDVSMIGFVEKKSLVLRNGARKGDIIFVTGSLGGSIRGKHLRFIPRLKEARFLVKNFKVHAMIDISDGLVQDLGHVLAESRAGAVIYENLIPIDKAARGLEDALYMGEDFELLFTLSRREAKSLCVKKMADYYKPIGEVVERSYGLRLIDKSGKEKIIAPLGFRHF